VNDPYLVTGEATIDAGLAPQFLLTAEGQQVDMSRLGAKDGPGEASAPIPLQDRIRALLALAADVPVPQMPGKASIRLPALITEGSTIRDIRLDMRPDKDGWQIDQAEAQLPGRTTLSAKGRLALGASQSFDGDLLLASTQPSGFAEWVTGKVPDVLRGLKSAGFSARVNLTPDLQRFEKLEVIFGTARLEGRLEREIADGTTPALSAELSGNAFDLDTFLALGTIVTGSDSGKALLGHHLAARLKVGNFSAFGLEAKEMDAAFSVANGAMSDIRLSVGDFYGTSLTATGGFANVTGAPKGEAHIKLKSGDPTAFFNLLAKRLPAHPALARLAASARYFVDSEFDAGLKLALGDWPVEATLAGRSNGSEIKARLAAQTLDLANTGGLSLEASLANPDAWVMLGQLGLATAPFDADQDAAITLKLDQPPDGQPQVDLSFASGTTSLSVQGQAGLDASHFLDGTYNVTLDSADLAPYLIMSGFILPRMADGLPVSATAVVTASQSTIDIVKLAGNGNGNNFTGAMKLARIPQRPVLSGRLALGDLSLDWLGEAVFGQIRDPLDGGLSTAPVARKSAVPIDIDLAVSAARFDLLGLMTVTDFRSALTVRDEALALSKAEGTALSGQFSGRAELGTTAGVAYLRGAIDLGNFDWQSDFWRLAGQPVASASGKASLIIDASGANPRDMLANAAGSGTLKLNRLRINGLNGALFPDLLAAADAIEGDISEAAIRPAVERSLFAGGTEIAAVDIPFTIGGNRLRADKISGGNPDLGFEGNAALDFSTMVLDAELRLALNPGEQALAGAEPALALGWTGKFAEPTRSLDLTDLVDYLSLRKFEQERRRVEILQGKVAEKQRLRREAALYRAHETERLRLKEKAEAEVRLMKAAEEALKALARAEAETRAREKKPEPAPLLDPAAVIRGTDLPQPVH
jgi:hypothetical protein